MIERIQKDKINISIACLVNFGTQHAGHGPFAGSPMVLAHAAVATLPAIIHADPIKAQPKSCRIPRNEFVHE